MFQQCKDLQSLGRLIYFRGHDDDLYGMVDGEGSEVLRRLHEELVKLKDRVNPSLPILEVLD